MSAPDPADIESLRAEIQSAIAAGREMGPDMDRHLADSVLDHYRREQADRARAIAPQTRPQMAVRQPHESNDAARMPLAIVGLIAFVAILVLRPEFWWVIFFLPGIFGAWGWGRRWHR